MIGEVGDRLITRRLNAAAPNRDGRILEVHGIDGGPPYLVQWSDDGQIGLVFPGPETLIERLGHSVPASQSNSPATTVAVSVVAEPRLPK
jgi:hypothetical protein